MQTRPRKRGFWALAVTALLLPLLAFVGGFASPVEAAPAQIPTPFTAVGAGGALTLNDIAAEPTSLSVPHPARAAECENGEDDETGQRNSGGNLVDATDGLIDHPTDGQCSTAATDNSELAGNFSGLVQNPQPKESAVFGGTRTGNNIAINSSVFPKGYLGAGVTSPVNAWWVIEAGLNITSTSGTSLANGSGTLAVSGNLVAKYARQSCSGFLCFAAPNNGACTGGASTINFTTETSGGLTGQRYDDVTNTMVIVSDGFTLATAGPSNALCDELNSLLGTSQPNNQAVIALSFKPTAGCGTSPVFNKEAPCWAPVADGTAPATADTGDTVTLDGSGSYDPGYSGEFISPKIEYGQLSDFTWSQVSGPAALPNPTVGNNADVTFPSAGTYTYKITASGNPYYSGTYEDTVVINVTDPVTTGDIQGTITDGVNPLPGMIVNLYPGVGGPGRITNTTTDALGNYAFPTLAPGNYRVAAYDPAGLHVKTWYNAKPNAATADQIAVTVGNTSTANVVIADASRLTGRLRNWNPGGGPTFAQGVPVKLYAASGGLLQTTTTNANGWYDFRALPAGSYKLFYGGDATTAPEWHGDAQFGSDSQVVTTTAGVTTIIDFDQVTPLTTPEYSGNVNVPGATVALYTRFGRVFTATADGAGNWEAFGVFQTGTDYYVRASAPAFQNEWWQNAGPAMNNCSGQPQPCVPTVYFADPISYGGGSQLTGINMTLVP